MLQGALIVNGLIPEDQLWNDLNAILVEIENLPQPVPWPAFDGPTAQLRLSVHRKTKSGEVRPPLEWAASALAPRDTCAAIQMTLEKSVHDAEEEGSSLKTSVVHDFARAVVFAANIARPGCLSIASVHWSYADGSYEAEPGIAHDLGAAVEYSQKTGWPPLGAVPLGTVYFWICSNLFHLRAGDTPVSRAFNAYTWLFAEPRSAHPFRLVAALIGIESLFATTTSGVGDQVRRRAQLLLGGRLSFKKDLDRMYAARSAFLHGGAYFLPNGLLWDPPDAVESQLDKGSHATDIASAVLVASLQRLAEEEWSTLDFSEELTGSKDASNAVGDAILGGVYVSALKSELDQWVARFIRRFD